MFKRVNEWLNQPVSRRGYLHINLILTGITAVGLGIYAMILFWDNVIEALERIKNKVLDLPIIRWFHKGRA